MEIFNSRQQQLGLIPIACAIFCISLSACSSTDEPFNIKETDSNNEVIYLSNGDIVILTDTATYPISKNTFSSSTIKSANISNNWFDDMSRATNSLRAYGYDSQEPESDWKKYLLDSSWEKYGITPDIYISDDL